MLVLNVVVDVATARYKKVKAAIIKAVKQAQLDLRKLQL
jgi:ribosomal protein S5